MVSSYMTRTGRVSSEATRSSPAGDTRAHALVWRRSGSVRVTRLAVKQLRRPEPFASARSARPLPVTTFRVTRLLRGRHGGPGSFATGSKTTKRAVGKIATPKRSLPVTRFRLIVLLLPPAIATPIPTKPASVVWIGTRARPLFVIVFRTIVVRACGGGGSVA